MSEKLNTDQLHELLYQALETENGGIKIYETAISCAVNSDLKEEWQEYLDETRHHHQTLLNLFEKIGLDPEKETPGRQVVSHLGDSLVHAMEMAKKSGNPEAAQLVAGECVTLAETKDNLNWDLIELLSEKASGKIRDLLKEAHEEIDDQEAHHLYHTRGWTRELWIESLGLPAALPPPEEAKSVKTAIGAERAKNKRDDMT